MEGFGGAVVLVSATVVVATPLLALVNEVDWLKALVSLVGVVWLACWAWNGWHGRKMWPFRDEEVAG